MRRSLRITGFVVTFFLCSSMLLFPQTSGTPTVKIEPYTKDEFPQWAKDLRRYEIVSLGSLPFVTLLTSLSYGLYLYFSHDMNSAYLPSLFPVSGTSSPLSQSEQLNIFLTSLGISAGIGLADFIIQKVKASGEKKAAENESGSIIVIEEVTDVQTPNSGEPVPEYSSAGTVK